jgi:hypothetical protein
VQVKAINLTCKIYGSIHMQTLIKMFQFKFNLVTSCFLDTKLRPANPPGRKDEPIQARPISVEQSLLGQPSPIRLRTSSPSAPWRENYHLLLRAELGLAVQHQCFLGVHTKASEHQLLASQLRDFVINIRAQHHVAHG